MIDSLEVFQQAQANRRRLQDEARSMGIDEAFISLLVDTFYDRVRAHPELGPVFANAIGENWEQHLPKMKAFWASVVLRTGSYGGKPMVVHQGVKGAKPEHFNTWLTLFDETLAAIAPSDEVAAIFMERANQMAARLQAGMFK